MEETLPGWMGTLGQLKFVLSAVRADQDESGAYYVRGSISTFMGLTGDDAECVVSGQAEYRADGKWYRIAPAMRATSYGVGVLVF